MFPGFPWAFRSRRSSLCSDFLGASLSYCSSIWVRFPFLGLTVLGSVFLSWYSLSLLFPTFFSSCKLLLGSSFLLFFIVAFGLAFLSRVCLYLEFLIWLSLDEALLSGFRFQHAFPVLFSGICNLMQDFPALQAWGCPFFSLLSNVLITPLLCRYGF